MIKQITAILLLCMLAFAAIYYHLRYYDISFFECFQNQTTEKEETLDSLYLPEENTDSSFGDDIPSSLQESDTGKQIAQPIYTEVAPFVEGGAVVGLENQQHGVIDTQGNVVVPFDFLHITNMSSGKMATYSESTGWVISQKMNVRKHYEEI